MTAPVFVSFSHEHDADHVSRLAAHLAAAGITARYDTQPMSESWWETYTRAQIQACQAVIALTLPQAGGGTGADLLERLRPAPVEAHHDGPLVPVYQGKMATAVGIETRGGVLTPLLHQNSTVPTQVTEVR